MPETVNNIDYLVTGYKDLLELKKFEQTKIIKLRDFLILPFK